MASKRKSNKGNNQPFGAAPAKKTVTAAPIADRDAICGWLCAWHDYHISIGEKEQAKTALEWYFAFQEAPIPKFNLMVLQWRAAGY